MLKRGFINKQIKYLVSSETARVLIDALPEPIKDPATTAVWEQALDDIAQGKRQADQFVQDQENMVRTLTEQVKQGLPQAFTKLKQSTPAHACPTCQHPLIRRKGKTGWFWGCSGYPECTTTLPDIKGQPGKPRQAAKKTGQHCPECETGEMLTRVIRKGKNKDKTFLGCSRYPTCTHTEWG